MPEGVVNGPGAGRAHRRGHWLERDLQRAIGAAERAGLGSYRIDIAPDGTISIVVGAPDAPAGKRIRLKPRGRGSSSH